MPAVYHLSRIQNAAVCVLPGGTIMRTRISALVLGLLLTMNSFASATGLIDSVDVAAAFETAMALFYLEDYTNAAEQFSQAGNYNDAKKWQYYCQAISDVLKPSASEADLASAQARFDLLAGQGFQQAEAWAAYCKGREYEQYRMLSQAGEIYSKILVHDSIERYLNCKNCSGVLESVQSVRNRYIGVDLPVQELYETAMAYYYLEDYGSAADFFCLAGNYKDSRQWRCYCTAINVIMNNGSLTEGTMLFSLLYKQGFDAAGQWTTYCKAREYEQMHNYSKAVELYKGIFVYDSSERYLALLGK